MLWLTGTGTSTGGGASGGCFPAHALATTPAGPVPMSNLKIGDQVLAATTSGQLAFERIFAFTDINKKVQGHFLDIVVQAGSFSRKLQVTPKHFVVATHAAIHNSPVFSASNIISAAELHVGNTVWIVGESSSHVKAAQIVSISSSTEQGFYAPQVRSGTIVVNGVVAATFTTALQNRLMWHAAMFFVQAWQHMQQSIIHAPSVIAAHINS